MEQLAESVSTPIPDAGSIVPAAPVTKEIPEATETGLSPAAKDAITNRDQAAYKAARHAERFGQPKDAPKPPTKPEAEPTEGKEPAKPVAEPAKEPERQLSKRQIEINDAAQKAADRATADLQNEVKRLKAQIEAASHREPPRATDDPEPDPLDEKTYPNGQFDLKFIKDLSSWQTRQDLRADREQQALSDRQRHAFSTFEASAQKSRETIQAAMKADPKALDGIDPQLSTLRPTVDLKPGEDMTFGNVIADWIVSTDFPVQILKHLSDRAEVTRLANLSPLEFMKEQGRIEARFATPDKKNEQAPAPPAKQVTEAADPAHTLGSRPVEAPNAIDGAVREHNFLAYKAAKRAAGVVNYAG